MKSGYQGQDSMRENAERMFRDYMSYPELKGARKQQKGIHPLTRGQTDMKMPRLLANPRDDMNLESMHDVNQVAAGRKGFAGGGYAGGGYAKDAYAEYEKAREEYKADVKDSNAARKAKANNAYAPKVQRKAIGGGILGTGLGGYLGTKAGRAIGQAVGGNEGGDLGSWLGSAAGSTLGGLGGALLPFKKGGDVERKRLAPKKREMLHKREEKALTAVRHGIAAERKMDEGHRLNRRIGGGVYERQMNGEHQSHVPPHYNYEAEMNGTRPIRKALAIGGEAKIRKHQATRSGQQITSRPRRGVC